MVEPGLIYSWYTSRKQLASGSSTNLTTPSVNLTTPGANLTTGFTPGDQWDSTDLGLFIASLALFMWVFWTFHIFTFYTVGLFCRKGNLPFWRELVLYVEIGVFEIIILLINQTAIWVSIKIQCSTYVSIF